LAAGTETDFKMSKHSKIKMPAFLKEKLEDSDYFGDIDNFVREMSEFLYGSRMEFFPEYTDHRIQHIQDVLDDCVRLIPSCTKPHFTASDAAVLICAVFLHDIGMHCTPYLFTSLINGDHDSLQVEWFSQDEIKSRSDLSWQEEWSLFLEEIKRWNSKQIDDLIGAHDTNSPPTQPQSLCISLDHNTWKYSDRLFIGEFIRRHHPRIAHEAALSGMQMFSRHTVDVFGNNLQPLKDVIGLVARSHGIDIRTSCDYLKHEYSDTTYLRCHIPYIISLIRIADYLQIHKSRAPAILYNLNTPISPISIKEWKAHEAVLNVELSDITTKDITIEIASNVKSVSLLDKLRHLLVSMQQELDTTTAVLDEIYSPLQNNAANHFRLVASRIRSNIENPAFINQLGFDPYPATISCNPQLMDLLISPLYGNRPEIGIRELVQNSVDSVRERKYLQSTCSPLVKKTSYPTLPDNADVSVIMKEQSEGNWTLKIQDTGMGMSQHHIRQFFLTVGSSYKTSANWAQNLNDPHGRPGIHRTGYFGIGIMASFLLGDHIKVTTRAANERHGFCFVVKRAGQLFELTKDPHAHTGTTIEVEISSQTASELWLHSEKWCWWTSSNVRVIRTTHAFGQHPNGYSDIRLWPSPDDGTTMPGWSKLDSDEIDIYIRRGEQGLSLNGFIISRRFDHNSLPDLRKYPYFNFNGDYGVCIWDKNMKCLPNIARDQISVIPGTALDNIVSHISADIIGHFISSAPTRVEDFFSFVNTFRWGGVGNIPPIIIWNNCFSILSCELAGQFAPKPLTLVMSYELPDGYCNDFPFIPMNSFNGSISPWHLATNFREEVLDKSSFRITEWYSNEASKVYGFDLLSGKPKLIELRAPIEGGSGWDLSKHEKYAVRDYGTDQAGSSSQYTMLIETLLSQNNKNFAVCEFMSHESSVSNNNSFISTFKRYVPELWIPLDLEKRKDLSIFRHKHAEEILGLDRRKLFDI
jgi:hypothetical protein